MNQALSFPLLQLPNTVILITTGTNENRVNTVYTGANVPKVDFLFFCHWLVVLPNQPNVSGNVQSFTKNLSSIY